MVKNSAIVGHRQSVNGISLYYELHAPPDSATHHSPIVFLHGLGSSTRDWELQIDAFSAQFPVICLDLRGHGLSDKPAGPYSIEMLSHDLSQLLRQLHIEPAHIVGLSMGAQVGMQLALDVPEQCLSLTIVNSPADMRPQQFADHTRVLLRKILSRVLSMQKLGQIIASRLLPDEKFADRRAVFARRWAENDAKAYRASFDAIVRWHVTDRLHELALPTLVVASTLDYTPLKSKQIIVDNAPNAALVVIEQSRHAVPVDQALEFNDQLRNFLDNVEATSGTSRLTQ